MKNMIFILTTFLIALFQDLKSTGLAVNNTCFSDALANQVQDTSFLLKNPLLSWLLKSPVEIGCMIESEFSYRDSIFNCDYKDYVNKGDPCKNTVEYYAGIQFPIHLVKKIHPSIKGINLDFEHGNLRHISVTFEDSLRKDKIREIFNLPSEKNKFPDNVIDISYGENVYSKEKPLNTNYTKWLGLTGFQHIGSADVDCK